MEQRLNYWKLYSHVEEATNGDEKSKTKKKFEEKVRKDMLRRLEHFPIDKRATRFKYFY